MSRDACSNGRKHRAIGVFIEGPAAVREGFPKKG